MQIFSLWCVSPTSTGGLSFTTADVGEVLAISGTNCYLIKLVVHAISFCMPMFPYVIAVA
jgi:hypothetical protein